MWKSPTISVFVSLVSVGLALQPYDKMTSEVECAHLAYYVLVVLVSADRTGGQWSFPYIDTVDGLVMYDHNEPQWPIMNQYQQYY